MCMVSFSSSIISWTRQSARLMSSSATILKHMKGVWEPTWDNEDAFGDGSFDLSRQEIWGSAEGKERLELEFLDRLFEHQVAQDLSRGSPISA
jgi:hypothetical protein